MGSKEGKNKERLITRLRKEWVEYIDVVVAEDFAVKILEYQLQVRKEWVRT